jgi:hypothetical protein
MGERRIQEGLIEPALEPEQIQWAPHVPLQPQTLYRNPYQGRAATGGMYTNPETFYPVRQYEGTGMFVPMGPADLLAQSGGVATDAQDNPASSQPERGGQTGRQAMAPDNAYQGGGVTPRQLALAHRAYMTALGFQDGGVMPQGGPDPSSFTVEPNILPQNDPYSSSYIGYTPDYPMSSPFGTMYPPISDTPSGTTPSGYSGAPTISQAAPTGPWSWPSSAAGPGMYPGLTTTSGGNVPVRGYAGSRVGPLSPYAWDKLMHESGWGKLIGSMSRQLWNPTGGPKGMGRFETVHWQVPTSYKGYLQSWQQPPPQQASAVPAAPTGRTGIRLGMGTPPVVRAHGGGVMPGYQAGVALDPTTGLPMLGPQEAMPQRQASPVAGEPTAKKRQPAQKPSKYQYGPEGYYSAEGFRKAMQQMLEQETPTLQKGMEGGGVIPKSFMQYLSRGGIIKNVGPDHHLMFGLGQMYGLAQKDVADKMSRSNPMPP